MSTDEGKMRVSATIDPELYRRIEMIALGREGDPRRPFSWVLEDLLRDAMDRRERKAARRTAKG